VRYCLLSSINRLRIVEHRQRWIQHIGAKPSSGIEGERHRIKREGSDWHPVKGALAGHWAVKVSGNWRLTFSFEGKDAVLVDYRDYH
jgi:proteic killer suppression protein